MSVEFIGSNSAILLESQGEEITGIRLSRYMPRIIDFPDQKQNAISVERILNNAKNLLISMCNPETISDADEYKLQTTLDDIELLISAIK